MVTNTALNSMLVSLVYELLSKNFMCFNMIYIFVAHACYHDMYVYFNQIVIY
jgi:hypothetical protein